MSDHIPAIEIFFGYFDAVSMKELATETPGPYFVFDMRSHRVLGSIDTSAKSVKNNPELT